ncbi:hypothetical protein M885DRAFT_526035 [Pelagophyceae sp. CCMP2097]|nr:hypothetical protein M885DRAFT_526035 [Pelagophyceae sp. CCMP2097]
MVSVDVPVLNFPSALASLTSAEPVLCAFWKARLDWLHVGTESLTSPNAAASSSPERENDVATPFFVMATPGKSAAKSASSITEEPAMTSRSPLCHFVFLPLIAALSDVVTALRRAVRLP